MFLLPTLKQKEAESKSFREMQEKMQGKQFTYDYNGIPIMVQDKLKSNIKPS